MLTEYATAKELNLILLRSGTFLQLCSRQNCGPSQWQNKWNKISLRARYMSAINVLVCCRFSQPLSVVLNVDQ